MDRQTGGKWLDWWMKVQTDRWREGQTDCWWNNKQINIQREVGKCDIDFKIVCSWFSILSPKFCKKTAKANVQKLQNCLNEIFISNPCVNTHSGKSLDLIFFDFFFINFVSSRSTIWPLSILLTRICLLKYSANFPPFFPGVNFIKLFSPPSLTLR